MAYSFETKNATLKVDMVTNENGYIAQTGETGTGVKSMTIPNVKPTATVAEAAMVWTAFITNIAGGRYNQETGQLSVTKKVVEE